LNRKTSNNGRLRLSASIPVIFSVLALFAGFIVLAQEMDIFSPSIIREANNDFSSNWVKPAKWFRSNAGGMALEETLSRAAALRNEYALAIIFAHNSEIPDFLSRFYDEYYLPEVRILYKNGEQTRTQWILRDIYSNTRINAVFSELNEVVMAGTRNDNSEAFYYIDDIDKRSGFIEIFDRNSLLITEYRFYENGRNNRINYEYNSNILINAVVSSQEENKEYKELYADYYRYNRSLSLRAIERIFFADIPADDESIFISFPRNVMDAVGEFTLDAQRINLYPDFFGHNLIESNDKILYVTDERGRILSETFYNDEEEIILIIRNIWENNRISSTVKIENDTELLAEYVYNSDGDKILERNFKNGVLERVVSADGNIEIEELYLNNAVVLRAVWEDGRKISETRMR